MTKKRRSMKVQILLLQCCKREVSFDGRCISISSVTCTKYKMVMVSTHSKQDINISRSGNLREQRHSFSARCSR